MAVANCPSCGGRIEFAIGSSAVVICDHCHSVVARTDRGLEDLGKVAALIETGSPLQRGTTGKYHGTGFRVTGRTQMQHQAGGVWDEWYAAFDDGRWGWLAEAQGKFFVTFKSAVSQLPARNEVRIGNHFGDMVIAEAGTATVISGEGEIPWKVVPGSKYDYADLSGPHGHFATIDYSEATPLLFKGEETTLSNLGIDIAAQPAREKKVRVEKLSCTKCGGPLDLVAPDRAERIICPNCGAMHDVREGSLAYLKTLQKQRIQPRIPLGKRGKIDGDEYAVAGFMSRSVTFDQKYFWTEYLLFNPAKGFRWLVDSDDHWSFVEPIAAGDVISDGSSRIKWNDKAFKIFQIAIATVESVLGEFYWRVEVGEQVRAVDYIAPPEGISVEYSGTKGEMEVNYSHARYMPVAEVEQAFDVHALPYPQTAGWYQPNPYATGVVSLWMKFALALLVIAIVIAIVRGGRDVFTENVNFGARAIETTPTATQLQWGGGDTRHIVFTSPFQLSGGKNLRVEGHVSDLNNAWVYVAGDLINDKGAIVDSFQLPMEFYSGYDGGEHWTEGSQNRVAYLSALPGGTYTMRLEGDWDINKLSHPSVFLTVQEGVFRWSHFWLALLLLTIPPVFSGLRYNGFETQRWSDSTFTQSGTEQSGETSSSSDSDDQ